MLDHFGTLQIKELIFSFEAIFSNNKPIRKAVGNTKPAGQAVGKTKPIRRGGSNTKPIKQAVGNIKPIRSLESINQSNEPFAILNQSGRLIIVKLVILN